MKNFREKTLEFTYQHSQITKDGSRIIDPWKIADEDKRHNCAKFFKKKSLKEFVICGSKYNPKLSKVCKLCNNSSRKGVGRVDFKNEWYKN